MSLLDDELVPADLHDAGIAIPEPLDLERSEAALLLGELQDPGAPPDGAPAPVDGVIEVAPEDVVEACGDGGTVSEAAPSTIAALAAAGCRVVVHTRHGGVRRGRLPDGAGLAGAGLSLRGEGGGDPEPIAWEDVKALFLIREPGAPAPAPSGRALTVTFHDGRQLAGVSPDFDADAPAFLLLPTEPRTRTAGVWIPRASAREIRIE